MTTLHQGKQAITDNLNSYVSAERDPAMHNLNVAIEAILDGLLHMKKDIDKLDRQVSQIASRQR